MSYNARTDYTSDGSTVTFVIAFPYILESNIQVKVNGVAFAGTLTFPDASHVTISVAQVAGDIISVYRQTLSSAILAAIQAGTINPADLNLDSTQLLYLIQEMADRSTADEITAAYALRVSDVPVVTYPAAAARANNYAGFDASGQPAILSALTPSGIVAGTLLSYSSQFATLPLADAACVALGGALVLDKNWILTANLSLLSKQIIVAGGSITRGTKTITFNNNFIMAGPVQWLDNAGSGALLGNIVNDTMYPEWLGAIGTSGGGLAAGTINSTAIQALEAFDGQSSASCRWLDFSGITYGINATITNPTAGTALRWVGHGKATTRIFSTGNGVIRTLTGQSAGSQQGIFQKDLAFFGGTSAGVATTYCTEVRDWCSWEHEGCFYANNQTAIYLRSYATSQFSENFHGRNNSYDASLNGTACIIAQVMAGTGSFRGFAETGFQWSRDTAPTSTTRFMLVGSAGSEFLYNGRDLSGAIFNAGTDACYVVDSQGTARGVHFINSGLDLEQQGGGGSITIGKSGQVVLGGAGYHGLGSVLNIKAGTAYFGAVDLITSGANAPIKAWSKIDAYTVTGNGAPFVLAETQFFQGTRHIHLRLSSANTDFQSYVDATLVFDDLGTAHAITVNFVKTIYNTLGITFDTTKIGVDATTGKLTFTANFGSTVIDVAGIVEHAGAQSQ